MKSTHYIQSLFLISLLFQATPNSTAHSVWIEPDKGGALRVRFAEPDGKLERSPGHLDSLSVPQAFEVVTNTPVALEVRKTGDAFELRKSSITRCTGLECVFTVMSAPGKPGRKPSFYARWAPSLNERPEPALTLDIVPTGTPGEARAFFRGKPLGGIKAVLRLPDGSERPLEADSEGYLRFVAGKRGLHHLSIARHREPLMGYHLGKPFDLWSHNASLTWMEP